MTTEPATIDPLTIDIEAGVLSDLRHRLTNTRWAPEFANDNWQYGASGAYLKELVAYWLNGYDWRRQERAMNAFAHFRTTIEGVPVHFMRARGKGPRPMPLLLSHGWPWTFWDFRKLIGPLSDPGAHGGDPDDAFDVIVPSLPGYGFSSPLTRTGVNFSVTADLWVTLMERLGYPRFAAHGGDWGSFITGQLGHKYADRMIGVHVTMFPPLDVFSGGHIDPADYGPGEEGWSDRFVRFMATGASHVALQTGEPQTPAFAFNDRPLGLCAWLVQKRRAWSDCEGNVEKRFSKDDLLNSVMIYWVTQTYGTSARYYYEAVHHPWRPSHARNPVIEAPTGVAVFTNEPFLPARRWAERYSNLKRWTLFPRGGHFAPMEEPQILIADIRSFFRALRE